MTHHFYSCDDFFSLIKGSLVLLLLGNNSEFALGWSEGWRVSSLWGSVKGWLQLDSTQRRSGEAGADDRLVLASRDHLRDHRLPSICRRF